MMRYGLLAAVVVVTVAAPDRVNAARPMRPASPAAPISREVGPALCDAQQRIRDAEQRRLEGYQAEFAGLDAEFAQLQRRLDEVKKARRFGLIHVVPEEEFDTHGPELAVRALVEFGLRQADKMGGRAARLKVTDPALAGLITATLADRHTTVEVVDAVPAVHDVLRQLAEDSGEEVPAALSAPGVTAERLHAFAEAAAVFFRAAPWRHLDNDDVIAVEAPTPPPGLSHIAVMGHWGLDFGLTIFPSRAAVERLLDSAVNPARVPDALWGVSFEEFDNVPWADADAFEQLGLAVAGGFPGYGHRG